MKNTGEILGKRRQEMGYSTEEISRSTKISNRIIQSIEQGDLSCLPSLPYVRGFIRTYSKHLKLDPDEIIKCFNQELDTFVTSLSSDSLEGSHPGTLEDTEKSSLEGATDNLSKGSENLENSTQSFTNILLKGVSKSFKHNKKNKLSKGETLGLIALFIVLFVGIQKTVKKNSKDPTVVMSSALKAKTPPLTATEKKTVQQKKSKSTSKQVSLEVQKQKRTLHKVTIQALEHLNIKFKLGSGEFKSIQLPSKGVHTFKSLEKMVFNIDNGKAAKVFFNGKEHKFLSTTGDPVELTFP